ncbi:hypothetical protein NK718_17885 [Alsobacter sp. SYSU M60028]|uniref:Uncharacterized protein n=1 Tax=Alsobacter ponti TaxID=2962936 RepID=A0ABT1LHH3_9HYPH|nr:hypothetical protein [Alsobacter ponti]MCP8940401.1 hypothetical protein [Alsobacter ponti]
MRRLAGFVPAAICAVVPLLASVSAVAVAGDRLPGLPPGVVLPPGVHLPGHFPGMRFAAGNTPVPVWVRPNRPEVVVVRVEPPPPPPPGPITAADLPAVPGYRPAEPGAPTLYVVDSRGVTARPGGARIVSMGEPQPLTSAGGFSVDSPTAPRIIQLQAE